MSVLSYGPFISNRKLGILHDLLKYRILTTEMIDSRHFDGKNSYVNVVLSELRKDKYIRSRVLKNSRYKRKGYAYHQLTETGKECLERHGVSVEGQSRNIYVNPHHIPTLIQANKSLVEFENIGWSTWDSRTVKNYYNLDYRSNVQGLVVSSDGYKYGLYTLGENVTNNTIGRIQNEIRRHKEVIENYIIVCSNREVYKEFISYGYLSNEDKDRGLRNKRDLNTDGDLKVVLFETFFKKRKKFKTELDWIKALCKTYGINLISDSIPEDVRQSFPIIVEYKGQEYYLVDLTDSDLNKYRDIKLYLYSNSHKYWEKRDVIVAMLDVDTQPNNDISSLKDIKRILISSSNSF